MADDGSKAKKFKSFLLNLNLRSGLMSPTLMCIVLSFLSIDFIAIYVINLIIALQQIHVIDVEV